MLIGTSSLLILAAALAPGAGPKPTHAWIADVKAARATLGRSEVRIEGEVVELRSTSPTAKRGFYRLIDASDATGVLIRTDHLPDEGGGYRVSARIASEQPDSAILSLEEITRTRTDVTPIFPKVAVAVSVLLLASIGLLLGRAMAAERRYMIQPPLWLLPEAGPYGKAVTLAGGGAGAGQTPMKYEPELEEADRRTRERLHRRKRSLLQALLGSLALTGVNATWMLQTRPASAQVPAFVFIDANSVPTGIPRASAATAETVYVDTASVLRIDSAATSRRAAKTVAQAPIVQPETQAVRTPGPTPETLTLPPPTPPPPAPPTPIEAPALISARRDPAEERIRAGGALSDGAARLVANINDRKSAALALLLPEAMAGDLSQRERFLKLAKDFGPKAELGTIASITLAEDQGEATFAVAFSWRGDFGVDRRKNARFQGVVRRQDDVWKFAGAKLLDPVP